MTKPSETSKSITIELDAARCQDAVVPTALTTQPPPDESMPSPKPPKLDPLMGLDTKPEPNPLNPPKDPQASKPHK